MLKYTNLFQFSIYLFLCLITLGSGEYISFNNLNANTSSSYAFWPNATIPFYIHPEHFDHEQALAIMTMLSMFTFKTCLKFVPVMSAPETNQHVLSFINPDGRRRCLIMNEDHEKDKLHEVILGYDCLKSPDIGMMVMRALGFPFEHNRASRDLYIEVLEENIQPGYIELYTKDAVLPPDLRNLPYDVNSVMHFGERDYSKNGHRTIIFKDPKTKQQRTTLTQYDLRKIEIVYGPECRNRDRLEKIELCQSYPGVARRKREVNLRINREITPPSFGVDDVNQSLKDLGIEGEIQEIIEQVYKISSLALKNARHRYCNNTDSTNPEPTEKDLDTDRAKVDNLKINSTKVKSLDFSSNIERNNTNVTVKSNEEIEKESDLNKDVENGDLIKLVSVINNFAKSAVETALKDFTEFCSGAETMEIYQRARCGWNDGSARCGQFYKSTKSGPIWYSTQHRPVKHLSTKHDGRGTRRYSEDHGRRSDNQTSIARKRRSAATTYPETESVENVPEVNKTSKVDGTSYMEGGLRISTQSMILTSRGKHIKRRYFFYGEDRDNRRKTENEEDSSSDTSLEKQNQKTSGDKNKNKQYVSGERSEKKQSKSKNITKKKQFVSEDMSEKKQFDSEDMSEKKQDTNEDTSSSLSVEKDKKKEQKKKTNTKLKLSHSFAKFPKMVQLSKENKEFYNERKWPGGLVPYVIQDLKEYDLDDMRSRLEEVNAILKEKTCVKIKEITEKDAEGYEDYLVLDSSPDYVTGRVGGRQNFGCVELFTGGQHRQHAAMMVMAMLGFYFEVARHDRDEYIRVHMRHVRPDKLHHFEKIRSDATFPLPYDYKSATHPAWQFWRKVGVSGISTVATLKQKDPDGSIMKSLGQNEELLSTLDIVKINSVYGTEC